MGQIKCLLKVVEKKEYAENLLDGILFSNSAYYFSGLRKDDCRLNLREGAISYKSMIYTSERYCYIYSFYTIYEEDLINGKINLNKRFKEQFLSKNCYIVLVDYEGFNEKIKKIYNKILEMKPIDYCCSFYPKLNSSLITQNFYDKEFQNEFRIVFKDFFTPKTYKRKLDGIWVDYEKRYNIDKDHKIYKLGSIRSFARILSDDDIL